ncbi:MAG: hypothetical protein EA352_09435 [Gemmatimonadales bacterium]|nr:MAG: hypothetical protein EA352_09435 [Gemmatimonadales bacterium]
MVLGLLATLAVIVLLQPPEAEAQTRSLHWTETRSVEMPGSMGMMMRAFSSGEGDRERRQAVHLQGSALIQEEDDTHVYVMDLDAGMWRFIDHEQRTVMEMSFAESLQMAEEFAGMMDEARMEADDAMAEARADMEQSQAELEAAMEEARAEFSFQVQTEATGEARDVGGVLAERHLLVAELEASAAPEGVDEPEGGALIFVVELWQSDDLPDAEELYRAWAEQMADNPEMVEMARELSGMGESAGSEMAPVFAMWDARIAAGMEELARAMEEVEGTTVRSSMVVALVPDGVEWTRDEVLAWEPESMGDRMVTEATREAREAAVSQARDAIRGRLGRFGGGGGDDAEEEDPPALRPMLRMTSEKRDVRSDDAAGDILGALMERIEGYQRVDLASLLEQAGAGG